MDQVGPVISVGRLRQNPTPMLREVRRGAVYTVTDRGWPVARVVPFAEPRWVPADQANAALAGPIDSSWAEEITAVRRAEPMDDPWRHR
jgi:prevent-host-death family protein